MIKQIFIVVALFCATTISLSAQNIYPSWYTNGASYYSPIEKNTDTNFAMFVLGTIDEVRCDSAFEIGVFCNDECRTTKPFYTSKRTYDTYKFYSSLVVNGVSGEKYSFRLYDHRNGVEVLAEETPELVDFVADGQYGSVNTGLYELAFKNSTTHRSTLKLTDEIPFQGTQYGITADGIACSYTRNAYLDGGYETLVLPFDADVAALQNEEFVFEKFDGYEGNTIHFVELESGEILKAGVAYLLRYVGTPSDGRREITFTGYQQQVSDNITPTSGWTGTFTAMDGQELAGKYILNIQGNMINKAGNGASLTPYHAYFELPSSTNATKLFVLHKGQTTGVREVRVEHDERVYDLTGRVVSHAPRKGIIVKNNKKIWIQ